MSSIYTTTLTGTSYILVVSAQSDFGEIIIAEALLGLLAMLLLAIIVRMVYR